MLHQLGHDDIVQGVEGILRRRQFLVVFAGPGMFTGAQPAVDEATLAQDRAHGFELGGIEQVRNFYKHSLGIAA